MHLTAIKLRGFKSFPDPVEMRLERGVAVVVGPNGSGKSNVADAILWATGSQSPTELRAEKADDILFAGSPDRPPAQFCEVELIFDNEDGTLEELDFVEVSVARRLHRGGEGQYLVNGAPVRRLDLVELLADVGLGGGLRSVIGQGKVEAILGSRPDERRALIEEAAGLGRFKRRRHRAELKLARVAVQTERARDLEGEVKGRLRPLALQATAAERAERLAGEVAALEARIAALDLAAVEEELGGIDERRTAVSLQRKGIERRLDDLLADRNRAEEELADAAGRRESATAALYRLRSAGERLELRRESAEGFLGRLRAELRRAEASAGGTGAALARAAADTEGIARAAIPERDALRERLTLERARLEALEHALVEREGLPPAARELAEQGERLALTEIEVEPGMERAVAAALAWRASALLASDAAAALALLERARSAGLGSLAVLTAAKDPLQDVSVVAKEQLLEADRPAVTREGHGYDPARGELWFAGETAEAVWLELEARRRRLAHEVSELEARLEAAEETAAAAETRAAEAREAAAGIVSPAPVLADPAVLRRLADRAQRLHAALQGAADGAKRLEAPMRARVDAGSERTGTLGEELRRLGAAEAEVRREAAEAGERGGALEVERARVDARAGELRQRLESAPEPAAGDDREELATKLERLERRRVTLGQVNPLAKEEYESEKERLTELATQRADLEQSLDELERLRDELHETVERRFAETFASVRDHFTDVAGTLFPGGEGRLRLTDPEEGEEEPGVEVELRPAGKRVTRLSLLSGGEKALGAISFLFALFLARPSPFYLLDEVEAALDDTNIGRFVQLLRRYSDSAQFIVVTHQKRTMEAADILYGVTMGADGVSQIVSKRLPEAARGDAALISA